MTIQELGAFGEMIGGIAIIVSLIYVAAQIRQNTRITMSAMAVATLDTTTAWYAQMGNNEQSSSLFLHWMAAPDSLTAEQRFQMTVNLHGLFLSFQNSYYLAKEGTLAQEILHSLTEVVVGVKDQPGFLLFWKQRKSIFFKEFQDYVDLILASERRASEGLYENIDRN